MFLHHSTSFKASSALYSFTTQSFTTAGVAGRYGPTLAQCKTAYAASSWTANSLYFNMTTQGYQLWTVPATGVYNFLIAGSRAGIYPGQHYTGGSNIGFGAQVQARLSLTINQVITIICGSNTEATNTNNINTYLGLGGGGGTFVSNGSTLLLAAGGGGGDGLYLNQSSQRFFGTGGQLRTQGALSVCDSFFLQSLGGTNGDGGYVSSATHQYNGGAGGGWLSSGMNGNTTRTHPFSQTPYYGEGGYTYSNGFYGGDTNWQWGNPSGFPASAGGFGGGGGGNGIIGGGGGGGYSGGGAGQGAPLSGTFTGAAGTGGGGGGSYIISSATNVGTSTGTFEGISTFNNVVIQNLGSTNYPFFGFNNSSGFVTVTKI